MLAVKDPVKLQEKLRAALHSHHHFGYNLTERPWTELDVKEAAWMVADYLRQQNEVINGEPLQDWLEESQFYLAGKGFTSR